MGRISKVRSLAIAALLSTLMARAADTFGDVAARAAAAREANDLPHAIELYQQALQLNPQWREGWWSLGTLAYDSDQYSLGRDAFRHLVNLDAKSGPGWALLGLCEFETGDYARSLADLERGIELGAAKNSQMGAVVLYHEALALTLTGEFDKALQKYAVFVRSGAANDSILMSIGIAALRERLLPKNISPAQQELYRAAGKTASLVLAGEYQQADQSFAGLLARYGNIPHVHYLYGVYMLARDSEQAIAQFQRELEIDPANADALTMLALALVARGDSHQALPYAQKAAQLAPNSAMAQSIYGRALVETGDCQRGLAQLLQAEQMDASNVDTHITLAVAYARLGRVMEARREREISKELTRREVRGGG